MRKHAFLAALVALLSVIAEASIGDEQQDVTQLDQLIAKVEPLLPGGWGVGFAISNDRWRRETPMLVVRSREKLPVEYVASIGRPAAGGNLDPYIVQRFVEIEFEFVPYITPQHYEIARRKNDELEQRRRRYEETRLGKLQSSYKGGFTPSTYQSRTGDPSPAVREYAFLWLRTKPQPLPTHHYGTLSVATRDLPPLLYHGTTINIHDAQKDQQYHHILDGLVKIFVPYATVTE